MKKITHFLKTRPGLYNLIVFLLMIIPAVLLFQAAKWNDQNGMIFLLGLVILANLFAVFPFNSR